MATDNVKVSDGRNLAYAEFGTPDGFPVMYCHGYPGNHRELEILQPFLEERSVAARVIALNRPGYGSSTLQPNRTFLDWPSDVAEAADQLGIDRFSVIGVSGGGPFALACAHALADRVTSVGIAVGLAPVDATGMDKWAGPSPNKLIRRIQFGTMSYAFKRGQEDRFLEKAVPQMGEVDARFLETPEARDWFINLTREAFAQGGQAAAHEGGLYRKPWGFDPQQVTQTTRLWYGGADETVPAAVGQWLADRIPNSENVVWPEHGHFSWVASEKAAEVFAKAAGH